jgi:hypothetical protein
LKKTSGLSVSGKNKDIEGGSGQQARARVLGFYMEIAVRDSFFILKSLKRATSNGNTLTVKHVRVVVVVVCG